MAARDVPDLPPSPAQVWPEVLAMDGTNQRRQSIRTLVRAFEGNRLSGQLLATAYQRLVPTIRRRTIDGVARRPQPIKREVAS